MWDDTAQGSASQELSFLDTEGKWGFLMSTEGKLFFLVKLHNQPLEKPLPVSRGCCFIALLSCTALQLCPSTCLWLCLRSQPAVFKKHLGFYNAGRMHCIARAIVLSGKVLL